MYTVVRKKNAKTAPSDPLTKQTEFAIIPTVVFKSVRDTGKITGFCNMKKFSFKNYDEFKIFFAEYAAEKGLYRRFSNCLIIPGLCDAHVHFREPGFSYKETIKSGSLAAAKGGYTAVCTMPNLDPAPDSKEHLDVQLGIIEKDAVINVYPFGTITKGEKGGELSDMEELSPFVCGFSDDGKGVQSAEMMEKAMLRAKSLDKVLSAHCEDEGLLFSGYIHDGSYAKEHGHRGISSESEYAMIKRDLELCEKTGCKYHVCHISAKESVELIRRAKKRGVNVTCETAPHYLCLCEDDLKEDGRFKMNPPLRSEQDKKALIDGIVDGTIDMIATDHAPHTKEEKSRGLEKSLMGISGIEIAFPLIFTHLVRNNIITVQRTVELMCINPRKRFDIPFGLDFAIFDINSEYTVDSESFVSMGKSTPFDGAKVFGENLLTVCDGKTVYEKGTL